MLAARAGELGVPELLKKKMANSTGEQRLSFTTIAMARLIGRGDVEEGAGHMSWHLVQFVRVKSGLDARLQTRVPLLSSEALSLVALSIVIVVVIYVWSVFK